MNSPPDLNRIAGLYPWMEAVTFGPWLSWCRAGFLGEMGHCRRALVIGDADGRFTARLLGANPEVEIDAVDTSTAMLRALIRRAGRNAARVRAYCVDARLWQPANPPYDLVVTHFSLDLLTTDEVRALAEKLRGVVSPSALWVVSEFEVSTGLFGRLVAGPVVAGRYLGLQWLADLAFTTLPDYRGALGEAGFALQRRRRWLGGLLSGELWRTAEARNLPPA